MTVKNEPNIRTCIIVVEEGIEMKTQVGLGKR